MNNLNSIILEGTVFSGPVRHGKDGELVSFYMRSERKAGEVYVFTDVSVKTQGKVANMIAEYCQPGRDVRVVGQLQWDGVDHYILGEHIEFRPPKK